MILDCTRSLDVQSRVASEPIYVVNATQYANSTVVFRKGMTDIFMIRYKKVSADEYKVLEEDEFPPYHYTGMWFL